MIRFKCPKCSKMLGLDERNAGAVGMCPECGQKFRVPQAPASAPPARRTANEVSPPRSAPAGPHVPPVHARNAWQPQAASPAYAEPAPVPEPRRQLDDDEDYEWRRRKKKRKRPSGGPLVLSPFVVSLIVLAVAWVVMAILTLIKPALCEFPLYGGWFVSFCGGVWLLVIAFEEDALQGWLCILVPFYSLYFIITRIGETWRPVVIQFIGGSMIVMGVMLGVLGAVREGLEKGKDRGPGIMNIDEDDVSLPVPPALAGKARHNTAPGSNRTYRCMEFRRGSVNARTQFLFSPEPWIA